MSREQPKPRQFADARKPNESLAPQHDEQAQDAPQRREQTRRIEAHDPSPRFDHAMALEFYNVIKPNGLVLGYTDGRPVTNANQFEQIAKEADGRGEHFFFAVATLKPEWSDPNTHEKGKVTTPSKDKAVNMPDGSKSHVLECSDLWGDCDAKKYIGGDLVEAAQHYEIESRRVKAALDEGLPKLGITPFTKWRSGVGWQFLVRLDRAIGAEEAEV